ncbi:peptide-methionine (S)-S-oxide reductase MsrA [Candidatus Epulonipiscium viviparus]|uniref:peptide-methionine (S)-S-oxide reductase MsrA n=1 Tax=Candidatus Epulonipiscium viviparus TaxID=420336 RepID=UPI00016C0314|nr:peptide-methionine (S)-S-oxide reductase MsrA [Candidatus Epulopiscium viviparus]
MKKIYLAGGCFWGLEKFLNFIDGVTATTVGFANGNVESPTYKEVCTDATGFVEAVEVEYDPDKIDLDFLLQTFFAAIDPTSLNKQGNDEGTQYRTGVYYVDPADEPVVAAALAELQAKYATPVVVENLPLQNYYLAEEYHQKYLEKNPGGHCHISPQLLELAKNAKFAK